MKKRSMLGAALAAACIMTVTAGTANAFTPAASGEASCLEDGSWQVAWSVGGAFLGILDTWELPSNPDFEPTGPVTADVVKTGVITYPADATEATETFVYKRNWADGQVKNGTVTATVARPADGCIPTTEVTPVAPTVAQSEECEVEGTLTIATTEGVTYLVDGVPVADGAVITGPGTFTVTAQAEDGYTLSSPLDVTIVLVPAVDCEEPGGEWCSPGYWRQPHHLDSWAATGLSPDDSYNDLVDGPDFADDPTLLEVLQSPQTYKGGAFNAVGDLLSAAHPDVDFDGERVEDSCTLD